MSYLIHTRARPIWLSMQQARVMLSWHTDVRVAMCTAQATGKLHILSPVPTRVSRLSWCKGRRLLAVCLDKIPLPELRRPSSRSSSREPRFVDRRPRKWTAAPSGECRAGSPWFRRHPIRSHLFFPQSTSRSATKIRCQGLFAANKEPPCQESLRLELWMKKYETSIGSIENSQTLPTQDEKKDETCTNEYAWIWSFSRFSQWLYPVLRHGGVCRLGRRLGTEKARTSNAASNCRLCPLCRSPLMTHKWPICSVEQQ